MADRETLLRPFASSIHAKASALRQLELATRERARVLESISDDIKKCTNFVRADVSERALDRARPLDVDLRTATWHDQPRFDPGRRVFHLEHIVPVSTIRHACLEAPSDSAVLEILATSLRVAWILKEEDSVLTHLGYRSRRQDPEAAYREAKISLVPRDT